MESGPSQNQFPFNLGPAANQNRPLMRRLPADVRRFPTPVYVRGEDIFCPLAVATGFGGPLDKGDNGQTASGVRTDRPGGIVGCALPMPLSRACHGTPFPVIPWRTAVRVSFGAIEVSISLVDVGPAGGLASKAIIDITLEGWEVLLGRKLDPGLVNSIERHVSVTIVGGAKYLDGYIPRGSERAEP